jgi:hypothetical protein
VNNGDERGNGEKRRTPRVIAGRTVPDSTQPAIVWAAYRQALGQGAGTRQPHGSGNEATRDSGPPGSDAPGRPTAKPDDGTQAG